MKLRHTFALLFLLFLWSSAVAAPVSKETAKTIAQKVFGETSLRAKSSISLDFIQYSPEELRSAHHPQEVYYYIFNRGKNEGFAIIAGDDRLHEVLAYDRQGHFDPSNIPAPVQYWLDLYKTQIKELYNGSLKTKKVSSSLRIDKQVSALLEKETIRWGQTYPYNYLCPTIPWEYGARAVTGCVATAIAQILRYHKWPQRGQGSVSYTDKDPYGRRQDAYYSVNFDHDYQWEMMPGNFEKGVASEEQAKAIGLLLKDVGMACHMSYSSQSSGALNWNVLTALKENLKYQKTLSLVARSGYSAEKWHQLIRMELDASRPVYYTGRGLDGSGHAFVCDGYDQNGLFHINWGWDGRANGFYSLEALIPTETGTGAGFGEYVMTQEIIAGIEPDRTGDSKQGKLSTPAASIRYEHTAGYKRFTLKTFVYQTAYERQDYYFRLGLYNDKGELVWKGTPISRKLFTMRGTILSLDLNYKTLNLPKGRYCLRPLWSDQREGDFSPCSYIGIEPTSTYFNLRDGQIEEIAYDVPEIPISLTSVIMEKSAIYAYSDSKVTLKLKNDSDREYYLPINILIANSQFLPKKGGEDLKQIPFINTQGKKVILIPPKSEKEETILLHDCNFAEGEKVGFVAQIPRVFFDKPNQDGSNFFLLQNTPYTRLDGETAVQGKEYSHPLLVVTPSSMESIKANGASEKVIGPTFTIKNLGTPLDIAKYNKKRIHIIGMLLNPALPSAPLVDLSSNELETSIAKGETISFTLEFKGNHDNWIGYKFNNLVTRLIAVIQPEQGGIYLTNQIKLFGPNVGFMDLYYDTAISTPDAEISSEIRYNPTEESISYKSLGKLLSIDLFALEGSLLKSFDPQGSVEGKISIADLPKGVYIVSLRSEDNKIFTQRIIR